MKRRRSVLTQLLAYTLTISTLISLTLGLGSYFGFRQIIIDQHVSFLNQAGTFLTRDLRTNRAIIKELNTLSELNNLLIIDGNFIITDAMNETDISQSAPDALPEYSQDSVDRAYRSDQAVISNPSPEHLIFYKAMANDSEGLTKEILILDYRFDDELLQLKAIFSIFSVVLFVISLGIGLFLRTWLANTLIHPMNHIIRTSKNKSGDLSLFDFKRNLEIMRLKKILDHLQKETEYNLETLEQNEALYEIFASSVPFASAIVDSNGKTIATFGPENALFNNITPGTDFALSFESSVSLIITNKIRSCRGYKKTISAEIYIDGQEEEQIYQFSFTPIRSPVAGQPVVLISTFNISEQKKHEHTLGVMASVFESREAIIITDEQTHIVRVNQEFCRLTGYLEADVLDQTTDILASEKQNEHFWHSMWQKVLYEGSWVGELHVTKKDERSIPVRLTISVVKDAHGITQNYVIVFNDISEQRKAVSLMRYHANFDTLTDLPNRRMFMAHLNRVISQAHRHSFYGALIFIDLDDFKQVNDSYGHPAGDKVLLEISKIIRSRIRTEDFIARLGGDEFVISLHHLDISEQGAGQKALNIARSLAKALETMSIEFEQVKINCSASMGITLYPKQGSTAFDLLREADTAMYQAKGSGRNRISFYSAEMQKQVSQTLSMANKLKQAISNHELSLVYQPQFDHNHQVIGAEALIRWSPDKSEAISPNDFIPLAEETGSIIEIGNWVLNNAMDDLMEMQRIGFPPDFKRLAINLSPKQFNSDILGESIQAALRRTGVSPERIELEITEGSLFEHKQKTQELLITLKKQGFTFSIDDFGTGYSSLAYLKQLPISKLKIDRYFVSDIAYDENDAQIVKTIISMAKAMGLQVIAEGVENEEQLEFLKNHHCRQYQGYYFSKPISPQEFISKYCAQNKSKASSIPI